MSFTTNHRKLSFISVKTLIKKNYSPLFFTHWAQAAPTAYKDRSLLTLRPPTWPESLDKSVVMSCLFLCVVSFTPDDAAGGNADNDNAVAVSEEEDAVVNHCLLDRPNDSHRSIVSAAS